MSRPIDADALKEKINTAFWSEIEKIIDSEPTVDVRPKGKWVNIYQLDLEGRMIAQCSSCCEKIYFYGSILNFCPNCGADMRDEQNG